MKDTVADNIVSYLSANDIEYKEENGMISFYLSHSDKMVNILYKEKDFYIRKKDYVGQPHVILHWNPKDKDGKKIQSMYGLCLTMDGSDWRSNKLSQSGQVQRVKEIVFELWDDAIAERFKELNVTMQTKVSESLYIDNDGVVRFIDNDRSCLIKYTNINFLGQTKEEILNFLEKEFKDEWVMAKFTYKGGCKKMLFNKSQRAFKLNDLTDESFWGRTGMTKINNNVIVVGLGSVGGLVLDWLCKCGVKNISIYDNDKFDVVNNTRHVLGIKTSDINKNKAEHLAEHYSALYPMIKIDAHSTKFTYDIEVPNDTLIFNTTGGSHEKMILNLSKILIKNKGCKFSYIDIFVEPFALGVHAISFCNSKSENDKSPLRYSDEERYIVTPNKDFRLNFDGCFTPTLPYGFTPLQIAIPWLLVEMERNKFASNHYTIPFLSLFPDKKSILNEKLSPKINPYRIGVKVWPK